MVVYAEVGGIIFITAMIGFIYAMFKPYYNTAKLAGYYERLRLGYKIYQYHESLKSAKITPEQLNKLIKDIISGG